jgi:hypothetical protein
MNDLNDPDITVLVAMGQDVAADRFFIVPTFIVREALEAAQTSFYLCLPSPSVRRTQLRRSS